MKGLNSEQSSRLNRELNGEDLWSQLSSCNRMVMQLAQLNDYEQLVCASKKQQQLTLQYLQQVLPDAGINLKYRLRCLQRANTIITARLQRNQAASAAELRKMERARSMQLALAAQFS